jgi:hypothetical protein
MQVTLAFDTYHVAFHYSKRITLASFGFNEISSSDNFHLEAIG